MDIFENRTIPQFNVMSPSEFFFKFLNSRDLTQPENKPLYRYKVKDYEYAELQEVLKGSYFNVIKWNACFVLYASEWWRRNYNGGHWSWEPIFNSINQNIPVNNRNEIVEDGFEIWNRQIFEGRGRRDFLGTVIIESGLPLKVLADEGHYITSIITEGYKELGNISAIQYEYVNFLGDIAKRNRLPQSLERDPFLYLLLEIITILVKLKKNHRLASVEEPVKYLDQNDSSWREFFPIRIEQESAKDFIDNLLSEITQIEDPPKHIISTTFELRELPTGWICQPILSIPSGSHDYRSLGLTKQEFKTSSSKLELFIEISYIEKRIGFAFKSSNNETFRIDGLDNYSLPIDGSNYDLSLYLSDPNSGKRIELDSGYENIMAYNEPAIFEKKGQEWLLIATGSVTVSKGSYLVLVNSLARLNLNSFRQVGNILDEKFIYNINSSCDIQEDGSIFKINFSDTEKSLRYEFHPADNNKIVPFFEKENKNIFIGFPRIFEYDKNGNFSSRVLSGLQYRTSSGWETLQDPNNLFGKVKIRYKQDNFTQFCRTISVIPLDFKVTFGREENVVNLTSECNFQVTIKSQEESKITFKEYIYRILFNPSSNVPEYFKVGLKSEEIADEAVLTVPFPIDQISFYDRSGKKLPQRANLFIQELHGTRLSITNLSDKNVTKSLNVKLDCPSINDIFISKKIQISAFSNENLSLINFRPLFERLFSLTENIDACVDLIFQNHVVQVRQFSSSPEIIDSKYLSFKDAGEESEKLDPLAFRFDRPFKKDEIMGLEYESEFEMYKLPQDFGIWLIFPSELSKVFFRPIAYKSENLVEIPSENCQEFHEVAFARKSNRLIALEKIVTQMTRNFDHPDWNRLDQMYKYTNHLPLATMDVWKAIANSQEGLIALSLRLPNILTQSLTTSFSILWYQFSVERWLNIFLRFRDYITEEYPGYLDELLLEALTTIDSLLELSSLRCIIELEIFNRPLQNVPNNLQLLRILIGNQLNGETGRPGLRARHDNERWPNQINDWVVENFIKLPQEIRHLLPNQDEISRYQQGVIYLPFILSFNSVFNKGTDNFNTKIRFRIQEIIDFDSEWFKYIYNLIHGYLWLKKDRYE